MSEEPLRRRCSEELLYRGCILNIRGSPCILREREWPLYSLGVTNTLRTEPETG